MLPTGRSGEELTMFALPLAILLTAAQSPADPITVTGTRLTPAETRRRAVEFVQRTGVANGERPVARWADPVCPHVQGLDERYAGIVERRMREIAAAAGVPVAPDACDTNIVVTFTYDSAGTARSVANRAPRYVADMTPTIRAAFLDGDAPVRWAYATDTRGLQGDRATQGGIAYATIDGGEGGGSAFGTVPAVVNYSSSMISTLTARVLTSATVIIDMRLVEGRPLAAVADYAAFIALAEIRAGEAMPPGSILGMFGGAGRPEFTDWDRAFLAALYRIPLDRMGRRHRGLLVRELVAAANGRRETP
jgi:hypothetical protein